MGNMRWTGWSRGLVNGRSGNLLLRARAPVLLDDRRLVRLPLRLPLLVPRLLRTLAVSVRLCLPPRRP
jgi:hypothetical protein